MRTLLGLILIVTFLFLSAIHFYWGTGGKWGVNGSLPSKENGQKVLNPKMFACFFVATGFLCFAAFVLVRSGILIIILPAWLMRYGLWIISVIFILRAIGEFRYVGFFKKIKATDFGKLDTNYFSPLCVIIGLLGIILALLK